MNAQLHNVDNTNDVGLWQIDSVNWGQCNNGQAPCDINANLECAKKIWGWAGNNWSLWSTCSACGCCSSREEAVFLEMEAQQAAAA